MTAVPTNERKITEAMRAELRAQNAKAEETRGEISGDGSLKKTGAFKVKLRTTGIDHTNADALFKEASGLRLDKYADEIAASVVEGLAKLKPDKDQDVWAVVRLVSLLHQRIAEFQLLLIDKLKRLIVSAAPMIPKEQNSSSSDHRDKLDQARINKLKPALRVLAELYLVGFPDAQTISSKKSSSASSQPLLQQLVSLLFNPATDKEFANLPLSVSFAKTFAADFCFLDLPPTQESVVPESVRIAIKTIISEYLAAASKHLLKMHKFIKKAEVSNYEHAVARGEVSEDRQERFNRAKKVYEKFVAYVTSLSASCRVEMVALIDADDVDGSSRLAIGINWAGKDDTVDPDIAIAGGPWEDEDTRAFYEDVIDLKDFVPAILIGEKHENMHAAAGDSGRVDELDKISTSIEGEGEASGAGGDAGNGDSNSDKKNENEVTTADLDLDPEEDNAAGNDEAKDTIASLNSKTSLDTFFNALANALSIEAIDKLAVEFCYIKTKTARKRLVQTLFAVPRQRLDILPYYARFVAILSPFMPEVSTNLISLVMLESFTPHNIEAICSLLETCGRFLFKTPETAKPTGQVLDIMMKKKVALNLDSRLILLIDNAFYHCNPPERNAIEQKIRSPLELYIRKLFYTDLSKKTSERILKQLRKLNWTSETSDTNATASSNGHTHRLITKPFIKPWKLKFSNLPSLAFLAFELSRYYSDFGVFIVDECLEQVRWGLETNLFKYNQRRLATVRFLGEMYNYRLIESNIIFDTLYVILRFGYENQFPEPGVSSPWDAPYDFFRVRLCCMLLETCGQCFDRGILAQKLDEFLAFLQVYIHSKPNVTMDVYYIFLETAEVLRPKLSLCKDYDEAVDRFNLLVSKYVIADQPTANQKLQIDTSANIVEAGGNVGAGNDNDESEGDDNENYEDDDDNDDDDEEEQDLNEGVDDDDEAVVVHQTSLNEAAAAATREEEEEQEAEFEKEFSKMMQDSLDSRKYDKKNAAFDVAIPTKRGVAFQQQQRQDGETTVKDESNGVVFSFLTKKGNKQQFKNVELPQNSTFVLKTKLKQEAELEERKQLKKLVLSYEDREHEEETAANAGAAVGTTVFGAQPRGNSGKGKKILLSNDRTRMNYSSRQ
ncbi:hypothetical protein HK100_002750 [Physocladia obscura]|uniref:MIF4G domain-containing protein n=1 Tax=Physocladia obscura TaxID=109957 RepID=A0AAD5SWH7_9FUNG|nr:hypothetical protein HK100_002750 [Physocladia obscura]